MNHLDGLKFVALTSGVIKDKTVLRRSRLIGRLEEQLALIKDPTFKVLSRRWSKATDGTRSLVDHERRVKPWWKKGIGGSYVVTVKYGNQPLQFENGKGGIEVPNMEAIEPLLDKLVDATVAGELDQILTKAAVKEESKQATKPISRPATK